MGFQIVVGEINFLCYYFEVSYVDIRTVWVFHRGTSLPLDSFISKNRVREHFILFMTTNHPDESVFSLYCNGCYLIRLDFKIVIYLFVLQKLGKLTLLEGLSCQQASLEIRLRKTVGQFLGPCVI